MIGVFTQARAYELKKRREVLPLAFRGRFPGFRVEGLGDRDDGLGMRD